MSSVFSSEVVSLSSICFTYALMAIFAQNAIFSRGLGISRLVQLVGDRRTNSLIFALELCVVQVLVAPLGWGANQLMSSLSNRAALRPLVFVACTALVCLVLWIILHPFWPSAAELLPMASLNSCVIGTLLVSRTQGFTVVQSVGFGFGSGLGYLLAVLLVTEAKRRLRSKSIPTVFRGLPIILIYIGILSLAIYGFTGHTVIL